MVSIWRNISRCLSGGRFGERLIMGLIPLCLTGLFMVGEGAWVGNQAAGCHLAAKGAIQSFWRIGLMLGRFGTPVETVAAEIHKPTASGEIILEGLHHALGEVLRMLRCDDNAIRSQRSDAFGMQVVIGYDVVYCADGGQPLVDVVVGDPARGARSAVGRIDQSKLSGSGIQ